MSRQVKIPPGLSPQNSRRNKINSTLRSGQLSKERSPTHLAGHLVPRTFLRRDYLLRDDARFHPCAKHVLSFPAFSRTDEIRLSGTKPPKIAVVSRGNASPNIHGLICAGFTPVSRSRALHAGRQTYIYAPLGGHKKWGLASPLRPDSANGAHLSPTNGR